MRSLLKKYKYIIITWIVLLFLLLYFGPAQNSYYLRQDVNTFRTAWLQPVLIWTWAIVSVLLLVFFFYKTKSFKTSGLSWLIGTFYTAMFLFIFQDLMLAGCLFVNRQGAKEKVERTYVVGVSGEPRTPKNFVLLVAGENKVNMDVEKMYRFYDPLLKPRDTMWVKFKKGLLGIVFQPNAFGAKP